MLQFVLDAMQKEKTVLLGSGPFVYELGCV